MKSLFTRFISQLGVSVVIALNIAIGLASAQQLYSDRPPVEELPSRALKPNEMPKQWKDFRGGMLNYVAELLALYPNDKIYFLARDGEFLYDIARLLYADDPGKLGQFQLLNVSRKNMNDPHLSDYLRQEGLTKEALAGKKAVFVDTGFSGTIPDAIKKTIGPELARQTSSHMVVSVNPQIPSARVFLQTIDDMQARLDPSLMSDRISSYEEFAHYTSSSDGFKNMDGIWVPSSSSEMPKSVQTSALNLMQDLKAWLKDPRVRKRFSSLNNDMRALVEMAQKKRPIVESEVEAIFKRLKAAGADQFLLDLIQAVDTKMIAVDLAAFSKLVQLDPRIGKLVDVLRRNPAHLKSLNPNVPDLMAVLDSNPELFATMNNETRSYVLSATKTAVNSENAANMTRLFVRAKAPNESLEMSTYILKISKSWDSHVVTDAIATLEDFQPSQYAEMRPKLVEAYLESLAKFVETHARGIAYRALVKIATETNIGPERAAYFIKKPLTNKQTLVKLLPALLALTGNTRLANHLVEIVPLLKEIALNHDRETAAYALGILSNLNRENAQILDKPFLTMLSAKRPVVLLDAMSSIPDFPSHLVTESDLAGKLSRNFYDDVQKGNPRNGAAMVIKACDNPDAPASKIILADETKWRSILRNAAKDDFSEFVNLMEGSKNKPPQFTGIVWELIEKGELQKTTLAKALAYLKSVGGDASKIAHYEKLAGVPNEGKTAGAAADKLKAKAMPHPYELMTLDQIYQSIGQGHSEELAETVVDVVPRLDPPLDPNVRWQKLLQEQYLAEKIARFRISKGVCSDGLEGYMNLTRQILKALSTDRVFKAAAAFVGGGAAVLASKYAFSRYAEPKRQACVKAGGMYSAEEDACFCVKPKRSKDFEAYPILPAVQSCPAASAPRAVPTPRVLSR